MLDICTILILKEYQMNIDSILTNVELNPIRKVNLPCDKCDGDCCGMIPMSKSFLKDMWKKHNLVKKLGSIKKIKSVGTIMPGKTMFYIKENICVFKTDAGCSIYEDRPAICRVYGETNLVRCPYENLDEQPKDKSVKRELVVNKNINQEKLILELAMSMQKG